jgi:hypothetical protein
VDELIKVAWAEDEFKAELIQGLLEDRGIPSVQQQLGVSGRQIGLGWPADRAEEARTLLAETFVEDEDSEGQQG